MKKLKTGKIINPFILPIFNDLKKPNNGQSIISMNPRGFVPTKSTFKFFKIYIKPIKNMIGKLIKNDLKYSLRYNNTSTIDAVKNIPVSRTNMLMPKNNTATKNVCLSIFVCLDEIRPDFIMKYIPNPRIDTKNESETSNKVELITNGLNKYKSISALESICFESNKKEITVKKTNNTNVTIA